MITSFVLSRVCWRISAHYIYFSQVSFNIVMVVSNYKFTGTKRSTLENWVELLYCQREYRPCSTLEFFHNPITWPGVQNALKPTSCATRLIILKLR
jgi:hypothetical protein